MNAQHSAAPSPTGFAGAFGDLFGLAYRVAYRILGDRGDAEDVAQEACARAAVRWDRLAERPEGWVVRVAANLAIDRYRRRRRPLPDPWTGFSVADADAAERLDLARALRRLPRRQRQVAVLRYLADWSEKDVARELGCSVGTVKSTGARALVALRRRLREQDQEDSHERTASPADDPLRSPFGTGAATPAPMPAPAAACEGPSKGGGDVPAS